MRFTPLSAPVLGAATVVSAPALWLGLVARSLPLDVALTRYLVAVVLCWAALSVVATFAFPEAGPTVRTQAVQTATHAPESAPGSALGSTPESAPEGGPDDSGATTPSDAGDLAHQPA